MSPVVCVGRRDATGVTEASYSFRRHTAVDCTGENTADKRCEDVDELGLRTKPQAVNARPMNRGGWVLS